MIQSQLRLAQITGSFGPNHIIDTLPEQSVSSVLNDDMNDVLSMVVSSIKRLNGGSDFNILPAGQFDQTIMPAINNTYYLGTNTLKWLGINIESGSLYSGQTDLILSGSVGIEYSAPALNNTISHNFKGVALELDSLAPSFSQYTGMVNNSLYNINHNLFWETTLLNAPYHSIREVVEIQQAIPFNNSLISNSGFSGLDVSLLPYSQIQSLIEIYLNGQLLINGTQAGVAAGTDDYWIDISNISAADIYFGTELEEFDRISIFAKYIQASPAPANTWGPVTSNHNSTTLSVGQYSGEIVTFGNGTLIPGNLYYLDGNNWLPTDSSSTQYGADHLIGIAINNSPIDGLLIDGYYHPSTSILTNHIGGKAIYISNTPGIYSTTSPSSGQYKRIVGYCSSISNIIIIKSEKSWSIV